MPTPTKPELRPAGLFPADVTLLEPDVAGPLAVFPIVASTGELEYRSFAEACALGFVVKELEGASVNDLIAVNPLDVPVLLFEGEEVKGAQQDRTIDVSVLVPAGATLQVPVSCVEAGRWDHRRHDEAFRPSDHSAFPELRAHKNRSVRAALAAGAPARAVQSAVWRAVDDKLDDHGAASPTRAMGDVYEHRRGELARLEAAVSRRDGQVGSLVLIEGRPRVLDYVSRPDVFAALFGPLLRGYCLDALGGTVAPAGGDEAREFLGAVAAASLQRRTAIGLGESVTFSAPAAGGSGLAYGRELVQLSAFAEDGDGTERSGRILRPSRRRR